MYLTKIELFAREQTNGVDWDYWGNKVRKFQDPQESGEFDQKYNRQNTGTRQIHLNSLNKSLFKKDQVKSK